MTTWNAWGQLGIHNDYVRQHMACNPSVSTVHAVHQASRAQHDAVLLVSAGRLPRSCIPAFTCHLALTSSLRLAGLL